MALASSRRLRLGWFAAGLLAAGCALEVQNPNRGETDRLLSNPADFEALLGSTYLRWHQALYVDGQNQGAMAAVLAFESFSNLNNGGMAFVIGIPRPSLLNHVGNPNTTPQRRLYYQGNEVARTASNALAKLEEPGFSLGSPARDARARAFAEFMRGLSLGYIALMYDSGSVIHPRLDREDPGELVGYRVVMDAALEALAAAITHANEPATGADGFPLPVGWIPAPLSVTAADFVRLVRTYRARLRAAVARSPAERAEVNWQEIIVDAENGVLADHRDSTSTSRGLDHFWASQFAVFTTWHQLPPFVIGMADVSGSYADWIAQPLSIRGTAATPLIVTPDLRFPQGATRAAQQADVAVPCGTATIATPCKRYFRNRPSDDRFDGPSWGWSNYDLIRWHPWRSVTGRVGRFPFFTKAELDLLAAEGYLRLGNYAAAAALINKTRVPAGLPAITALDAASPVPGGPQCVPKVPVGPEYTTLACGTMLEALKWEKRIETQLTGYAGWYLDMRGWGDLPEGTPIHWPVPWEDLLARGLARSHIYTTGGSGGNTGAAPRGTYGW